jgi:hypothetical protein
MSISCKRDRDEYTQISFMTMDKVHIDGKKNIKNTKIEDIISSKKPTILVCIAHTAQLTKIENACIKLGDACNFNILIDEVDSVEAPNDEKTKTKRVFNFRNLKNHAKSIIGVSATGFVELFGDEDLKAPEVFRLPIDHTYLGVDKFEWNFVTRPFVVDSKISIFSDIELLPYMDSLLENHPAGYLVEDHNGNQFTHPVNTLIKMTTINSHFDEFMQYFEGIRDTRWCIISYSGEGIKMYHHSFVNSSFSIKRKSSNDEVHSTPMIAGSGILTFKECEIGDVLEHLRKCGVEQFSHIAIIAGRLADRGINYVSNNYTIAHRWHLTDMYFKPSKTSDTTALIQSMRPCGKYGDFLIPTITTFENVKNDILKSVAIIAKIVTECENYDIEDVKEGDYSSVRNIIKETVFTENEIPEKKLTKKVKCESDLKMGRMTNATNVNVKKDGTKISKFKNLIESEKLYTKNQILEMLKISGYENPSAFFHSLTKKDKTYGSDSTSLELILMEDGTSRYKLK